MLSKTNENLLFGIFIQFIKIYNFQKIIVEKTYKKYNSIVLLGTQNMKLKLYLTRSI